jgi:hypothetical protein
LSLFDEDGDGKESEATLWSLSQEFFEAAIILKETKITKINHRMVIYYLLGHSAELLFKSYLFKNGSLIKELKKIGHNLEALVQASNNKGLRNFVEIRSLSNIYNNKGLEYRSNKNQVFPSIEILIKEITQLQSLVFDQISAFH